MSLGVFDVIDTMTGYQPAAALTAAARLGVFDVLGDAPLPADAVTERLGTEPLATRALLDALTGLGLLTVDSGRYQAVPVARRLRADGDLRLIAEKEAFFANAWLSLADSVRTGRPRLDPWRTRLAADPDQVREFLRALIVLARETGPDLTRLPGVGPGAKIADLGGGLGSYAAPLAAAGARVTLIDLPPVAAWARDHLAEFGVGEMVDVREVDLLASGAADRAGTEGGYDVVLLSHLLHDLDDTDCAAVLQVSAALCRPGGQVVVFELPGDPPGTFGPMFDLMMRVETAGRARRSEEFIELLRAAGLTDVHESSDYQRPHGVFIATR
ncbi:methyltransferase [Mycolicibacterium sp. CBM1]